MGALAAVIRINETTVQILFAMAVIFILAGGVAILWYAYGPAKKDAPPARPIAREPPPAPEADDGPTPEDAMRRTFKRRSGS